MRAALASTSVEIEHVFASAGDASASAVATEASARGITVLEVEARTLDSIAQTRTPQGVVAVARFFHRDVAGLTAALPATPAPCLVAVLHCIADPGNAGTLIRSADALGASAVACGSAGVDPYNDKVIRATMGAVFALPLFLYDDWPSLASAAAAADVALVGADAGAPDVRSVTLPPRVALVVGHERRGLEGVPSADLRLTVGIPQRRRTESLNAGVAGSIALYEIARETGCLPRDDSRNE